MPAGVERALIVGVEITGRPRSTSPKNDVPINIEESLEELGTLAQSAGAQVVRRMTQARPAIDAATLLGSGKVEELKQFVDADEIDTVIFDHELTPTQLRNLERKLQVKIVDRTQLILDIFASRARTSEGQLQVELAQLNYLLPRLAGRGTEMSRLGGGIGTRGPGETQLETDRRRIGSRISKLKRDIERVRTTRGVQRSQRQAVPLSTISLVGYTNAGKSTLFNRLTGAAYWPIQNVRHPGPHRPASPPAQPAPRITKRYSGFHTQPTYDAGRCFSRHARRSDRRCPAAACGGHHVDAMPPSKPPKS